MNPTVDVDFNAKMRRARFGIAAGQNDAFAPRVSGLPIGTFERESWWTRFSHRLVFWVPFAGLVCALIFRW